MIYSTLFCEKMQLHQQLLHILNLLKQAKITSLRIDKKKLRDNQKYLPIKDKIKNKKYYYMRIVLIGKYFSFSKHINPHKRPINSYINLANRKKAKAIVAKHCYSFTLVPGCFKLNLKLTSQLETCCTGCKRMAICTMHC